MINIIFRRAASSLFFFVLIVLGLYSFLHMNSWDIPYTLNILEACFFSFSFILICTSVTKSQQSIFPYSLILFLYITLSGIYATIIQSHYILDYFLVYKAFIYLLFLSLIVGKRILSKEHVYILIKIIYAFFILKYSLCHLLNYINRPFIYTENNFELMFIAVLYLYISLNYKEKKHLYLSFFGLITALSFSRSGAGIFIFVAVMSYVNRIDFKILLLSILAIPILALLVYFVFASRGESIESLDRLNFLRVFLNETEAWTTLDYLIGSPRITQLSYTACQELSFYEVLFSKSGSGNCYSVIFHSFILRVIFDHGILGFYFILFLTFKILRLSHVPLKTIWTFLGIFVLNGISVSSFNSVFFPLSMVILINSQLNNEKNINNNTLDGGRRSRKSSFKPT